MCFIGLIVEKLAKISGTGSLYHVIFFERQVVYVCISQFFKYLNPTCEKLYQHFVQLFAGIAGKE